MTQTQQIDGAEKDTTRMTPRPGLNPDSLLKAKGVLKKTAAQEPREDYRDRTSSFLLKMMSIRKAVQNESDSEGEEDTEEEDSSW